MTTCAVCGEPLSPVESFVVFAEERAIDVCRGCYLDWSEVTG